MVVRDGMSVTRTLTIPICTHDRAGLLEQALRHLNAARRPPGWGGGPPHRGQHLRGWNL
jgi:hypothetical protein